MSFLKKSKVSPLAIDCKGLYDAYYKANANIKEKRTLIDIKLTKETCLASNLKLLWVSSERQLADGLTKASARQALADRLRSGRFVIKHDPSFASAKKKPAAERAKSRDELAQPRRRAVNT